MAEVVKDAIRFTGRRSGDLRVGVLSLDPSIIRGLSTGAEAVIRNADNPLLRAFGVQELVITMGHDVEAAFAESFRRAATESGDG